AAQRSGVDVLDARSWMIAVIVPSRRPPTTTCCTVYGRAPTGPNIWRRVSTIFTGRFTCRAAIAARTTCDHADPFEPNAPPTNFEMTRTFSSGMPSVLATNLLTPYTYCVAS